MARKGGRARGRRRAASRELVKAAAGMASAELSRTGARTTGAQTVSLVDAVQGMTRAALTDANVYAPTQNLPRDPLDLSPFGPLAPLLIQAINPPRTDTGRPEPRVWEYPQGFNLPGGGDRLISWETLRAAAASVDIIRRCIEIRKDDISAMSWKWQISEDAIKAAQAKESMTPRDEIEARLRQQFAPDIERLTKMWERPWITNGVRFRQWVAAVMEDHIVLDGVAVYPIVSVGGDVIGFRLVDGTTIKLLINDLGERPQPPYPAFQQQVYGFPRGEFIADVVLDENGDEDTSSMFTASQLTYWRENYRTFTPYGLSQVEQALISAALYLKRQGWMHAEYDEGSTPLTWLVPDGEKFTASQLSPMQRREYEQAINDDLEGQTGKRHRIKVSYPGFKPEQMDSVEERYKPEYDLHLIKLVASHLGVTLDRLGFTEAKGLGATGQHERQAEVQDDSGVNPDALMLTDLIHELSRNYLDAPDELVFAFIKEKAEDEAAKDAVLAARRQRGTISQNEDRKAAGLQPLDIPEADMPSMVTATGIVYIEGGAEQQAKMNELAANPPAPGAPGLPGAGSGGGPKAGPGGGGARAGGSKPKPSGPKPAGPTRKAADSPGVVAAELLAYRRWLRKQAGRTPVRPFRFEHVTPRQFDGTGGDWDGRYQEFDGYEWVQDIAKDWRSWNAAHPLHPRGPHGRFVRVGDLVGELRRTNGPLSDFHEDALDEATRRVSAGRPVRRGESQLTDDLERHGLLEEYGGVGGDKGRLGLSEAGRRHLQQRGQTDATAEAPASPPVTPEAAAVTSQAAALRSPSVFPDAHQAARPSPGPGETRQAYVARLNAERDELAAAGAPFHGSEGQRNRYSALSTELERLGDPEYGRDLADEAPPAPVAAAPAALPPLAGVAGQREHYRDRRARMERATALADAVSRVEEYAAPDFGAEPAQIREAVRRIDSPEAQRLADELDAIDDPAQMSARAHEFAREHGLSRIGEPGSHAPFEPALHTSQADRALVRGEQVYVIRPGYVMTDLNPAKGQESDLLKLRRAEVMEPMPPKARVTMDDLVASASPHASTDAGRGMTDPVSRARLRADAEGYLAAIRAEHGDDPSSWSQDVRDAAVENQLVINAAHAADRLDAPPGVEDARGQGPADRLRQAEVMYGSDRSKWPPREQREAARLERLAARQKRSQAKAETSTALGIPAAAGGSGGQVNDQSGTVAGMEPEDKDLIGNQHGEWEPAAPTAAPDTSITDALFPEDKGRNPLARLSDADKARLDAIPGEPVAPRTERVAPEFKPVKLNARQVGTLASADNDSDSARGTVIGESRTLDVLERHGLIERTGPRMGRITPHGRTTLAAYQARSKPRGAGVSAALFPESEGGMRGAKPQTSAVADEARQALAAATSREQAARAIDAMGLTAAQLKALAKDLGVPVQAKARKDAVRDTIVSLTAGRRLDSRAIFPGDTPVFPNSTIEDRGQRSAPAGPTPERVEQAVRDLVSAQGSGSNGFTSLVELRQAIGGTRADQDALLLQMARERRIYLAPEENQQMLEDIDREAALDVGGEPKHAIRLADAARRTAPAAVSDAGESDRLADLQRRARTAERASTRAGAPLAERLAAREEMHEIEEQIRAIQYPEGFQGPPARSEREIERDIRTALGSHSPAAPSALQSLHEEQRAAKAPEPVKTADERQLEIQTASYQRLLEQAEALDMQINFAESDAEHRRLLDERESLDQQMAALDRQIAAARQRKARSRRTNKAAGADDGGKA